MTQSIPKLGSVSFEEKTKKMIPNEWGFGSTPRTADLRAGVKWKAAVVKDFEDVMMGLAKCEFRNGQHIKGEIDRGKEKQIELNHVHPRGR